MKEEIEKIITQVVSETPDWANWDSHTFENSLVDEGDYVKLEDFEQALKTVAYKVAELYDKKL